MYHRETRVGLTSCRVLVLSQLPVETIKAPVDKSDFALDLQTDISFGGNGAARINKLLES